MPLHHMQLKSAVAKYTPIFSQAGVSENDLKALIGKDDKGYTPEEIDEIIKALFTQTTAAPEPAKDVAPVEPTAAAIREIPHGKKLYDIWRGTWTGTKKMIVPGTGQELILEWKFLKDGVKPIVSSVPCEPDKAELFNKGKYLRAARLFTEQMIEVGDTSDVLDIVPNPYEIQTINN